MSISFSAVVCAAGQSERFKFEGQRLSKQLVSWNDSPLIIHTLRALFTSHLKQAVVVVKEEDEKLLKPLIEKEKFSSHILWARGGARRQDSVRNGLEALTPCDRVGIHDGARPFLSEKWLTELWLASTKVSAIIPALPMIETIKEIKSDGTVEKTHDRKRFIRVQTPQIFDYSMILKIHQEYAHDSREFTDDAAMVEASGQPVSVFPGELQNIKVTTIEDLKGIDWEKQYV